MDLRYDAIGHGYARTRREDPRLRARIAAALGDARTVVNVGAGAGSYEPEDRHVIAVEPSDVMAAQRPRRLAPALRARAGQLPLRDGAVDAAMAILTVHHWDDEQERGVRELRRVATGPVVILTCDADVMSHMWLIADYFPELGELDRRTFPRLDTISAWLGGHVRTVVVPVPRDTVDWSLMSFWAHPLRVFDDAARNGTSGFARMDAARAEQKLAGEAGERNAERLDVERVMARLRRDLDDGTWAARHGHLDALDEYDVGMRLIVATP